MTRFNPTASTAGAAAPTTSATVIVAAEVGRSNVHLMNNGSQTVFIGGSGVTTATGFPLKPGEHQDVNGVAAIYGITATGTGDIRYLTETNPFEN